jgi:hypothetical protein
VKSSSREQKTDSLFEEWVRCNKAVCPVCDRGYDQFDCICEEMDEKKTEIEKKLLAILSRKYAGD